MGPNPAQVDTSIRTKLRWIKTNPFLLRKLCRGALRSFSSNDSELIRRHRVVAWDDITLERSKQMPKYLFQGSYTEQGLKGVLQEGGSKRREAAEQLLKGMGGRLEAYYYAFGNNDFVIIADLPSNVDAAALSLAVNASGAVESRATVLITPEEVDQATKKTVKYRPPGK